MNNFKFYAVVLILVLAGAVGIISYLPVKLDTASKIQVSALPMRIGAWEGKDIPLTQKDYDILETTNLVMREYAHPSIGKVLLYIIYSEDNRKVSHPPEVCYTGGGSTITEKGVVDATNNIKANKMITETSSGLRQFVLYWYKAGELNTAKYMEQQARIVWRRTFGKKTSAAMIRVSSEVKEGKEKEIYLQIRQFCEILEPLLQKYVP